MKKGFLIFLLLMNLSYANELFSPASHRLTTAPTALVNDGQVFSVTGHLHSFFGVANVLGATLRTATKISDKMYVGLGVQTGLMFAPLADEAPLYVGGGPALTYGTEKFFVNLNASVYGGFSSEGSVGLALPAVGVGAKISNMVRFHSELMIPIVLNEEDFDDFNGGALSYGFRFGRKFYAAVDMILPFGGDVTEVYQVFPLGIPILSVGGGF